MITKNVKVPTGNICIMEGEKGKLEFLSIGDYGKEHNIKADFMGLTKEINGVPNCKLLPLEEKWVITISTQYGCSMNCSFCDVPKVGKGYNATKTDLVNQVLNAINLHPEVKKTGRLNLHYARMGEPTFNMDVIEATKIIDHEMAYKNFKFHPVISTMMPKNNSNLHNFLNSWIELKNQFNGEAGLQLSINTTDEDVRSRTMPYAMKLQDISDMMFDILTYSEDGLKGRKIALNFAITDAKVDAKVLSELFSTKYFMCKITPMHLTKSCIENSLITENGYTDYYPYKQVEKDLKDAGFDVLVFIPSKEEDESRITCGNAILSDSTSNITNIESIGL
jgi:23S rRNA (adenine2503-C2)-methyltransferase